MSEYTALHSLQAPGALVFGYHRGDPVTADVVEAWGLTVGTDVVEGDLPRDEQPAPVAGRPDEGANRAAWEAYAIAHGMDEKAAVEAPLEELQADRDAKGRVVERPSDNAKKADWVGYVKKLGGDADWADAESTTRADLQAWQPEPVAAHVEPAVPGDTVAVAAAEATKGA